MPPQRCVPVEHYRGPFSRVPILVRVCGDGSHPRKCEIKLGNLSRKFRETACKRQEESTKTCKKRRKDIKQRERKRRKLHKKATGVRHSKHKCVVAKSSARTRTQEQVEGEGICQGKCQHGSSVLKKQQLQNVQAPAMPTTNVLCM